MVFEMASDAARCKLSCSYDVTRDSKSFQALQREKWCAMVCLFNVLAVLIQRGSANAAQFTSGKQWLEQIPCIHRLSAKDSPGPGTWT